MIAAQLEIVGAPEVVARLESMVPRIHAAAKRSLDMWATELAGYIKESKLSGDPLHRRSGDLSRSVVPYRNDSGAVVEGGAGAGAGVPYAKIHEFGGQIDHPGGTAYLFKDGRPMFISNAAAAAMPWLPRTGPHIINVPERSYMRSAFNERAPSGIEQLRAAVKEAIAA